MEMWVFGQLLYQYLNEWTCSIINRQCVWWSVHGGKQRDISLVFHTFQSKELFLYQVFYICNSRGWASTVIFEKRSVEITEPCGAPVEIVLMEVRWLFTLALAIRKDRTQRIRWGLTSIWSPLHPMRWLQSVKGIWEVHKTSLMYDLGFSGEWIWARTALSTFLGCRYANWNRLACRWNRTSVSMLFRIRDV